MNAKTTTLTAVCHVRAPLLLEPIDRQVETLRACESEGTIDDLLLRSWPKEVALSDDSPYQEALEAYDRFRTWADRRGVNVRPPFRERTTTSQVTGETSELLVTPLLCLELYADDEPVGVFPHSVGDETVTTEDAIASLRCGELPAPLEGDAPETAPRAGDTSSSMPGTDAASETRGSGESTVADSDGCPDCDGALIDGQGLFACSDCGWTGTITETGEYASETDRTFETRDVPFPARGS
ncbi:HTH domain-containing protein [Natronococcus wangiae]|uniref:HTH domain-containing protein n=1 Tax=Natronococcus wangiae TaxID=3068275 RepID=UPI00273F8E2D|nr:HTH domain-containing protein [Natronococcus sp. AD5]